MLTFEPVKLSDYGLVKEYLDKCRYVNSEYNFTTIFAWQLIYATAYTVVCDCLCIRGINNKTGERYFYFPLGEKENTKEAINKLIEYTKETGLVLRLMSLSQKMLDCLEDIDMSGLFSYQLNREVFDYIYTRESLVTLSGKKLHGKRNHFNYFINNYNWELRAITEDNINDCRLKLKELIIERSANPEEELNATMMALEYRELLHLTGRALYAENTLCGVILAENHHGMALIQIAKTDVAFRGASVAMFKLFLEQFFTDCEYVNFMEDMGLEGLRKAKLSYNPQYLVEKSNATLI